MTSEEKQFPVDLYLTVMGPAITIIDGKENLVTLWGVEEIDAVIDALTSARRRIETHDRHQGAPQGA